ncbi:MAG: DUF2235 domain-containing protein [Paracoccus sp. (in: a-proteobacteria)]|jgi:hypothetical protein|uniref:DUF2235 domain-containing protein n=1 Tax=unclassified Paracoccus (in: a-proteobacteria) TaxID=2688777 RepID=UPI000C53451C|nr:MULTISPECIES: DUF2235 domain-containing protein [unclassified Paracoccus (in: a-proteobacteria)]MAN56466.1 hypothetical protein [Paracoccus sp. (in: a-proteobacteria)]MBA50320.1 hypothetical protein [Paracoccus sp. (in: a-proteobacteria)]MCS5601776.1 DUF2235 domain-containing protein [Paracoccus sp. (in: a-proteobacteria)]HIC66292.1 DUF2235 domain-containing protein [Paracoccus sp. (in: a-proteobacteria)]|tara:strand:- start:4008 stop:5093 length:1086 start_codon:yes stop_codon:yes gene_type:complete
MVTIRPVQIHVVLMDGTFASLDDGRRSSIGRIHRLLTGLFGPLPGPRPRIHYGLGQQWNRWRTLPELAMGRAMEARIIDAYGWLASGYRPGDQIFLFGYSRGAFAVRSLAGMIGRIGLLRADAATERNTRLAWRYYRDGGSEKAIAAFHRRRCRSEVPIRMVGCFDTVMALGLRLPLLWMLTEPRFRFHDPHLGGQVEYGFQALALDETRAAFAPLLWDDAGGAGHIEQMWFRGAHADIGGQLSGLEFARPLANIPLVWMLEKAEGAGLPLPHDWQAHFPGDPTAPGIGSWRKWGKAFLSRAPRVAGTIASEALHPTVPDPYPGPALLTGHLAGHALDMPRRISRRWKRAQPASDAASDNI